MIANNAGPFVACLDTVLPAADGIAISTSAAAALHVKVGDTVSVATLRPQIPETTA